MQEYPDSPQGGHIYRAPVRLPPFWPIDPASGSPRSMSDTSGLSSRSCRPTGSSARCGPSVNLHRPIINRSKSNPQHFSGQSAAQDGLARLQPRRIITPLRIIDCPDGLTRLQPRRTSAQLRTTSCPGRTHSPAVSPDQSTTQAPKLQ